jgi:Domain of unknown function (4846)
MKLLLTAAIVLSSVFWTCNFAQDTNVEQQHKILDVKNAQTLSKVENKVIIPNVETDRFNESAEQLGDRINVPKNYVRSNFDQGSLEKYLRDLPLKKFGSLVKKYDGTTKAAEGIYCAVVDKEIGTRDLHQCADACMYLWASYLFESKQYEKIRFKFLGDDSWHYYKDYTHTYNDQKIFFKYIQEVWSAANTRSLHGSLTTIPYQDTRVGDILIQVGNPYGHAVMIVDECVDKRTGKKLHLLAQSYMPAQETQILLNPNGDMESPWFDLSLDTLITPEWTFYKTDFKRF